MPEAAPGGTAAGVSSGGDVEVVRKEMFSGGTTSPSSSSGEFSLLIFSPLALDRCSILFPF